MAKAEEKSKRVTLEDRNAAGKEEEPSLERRCQTITRRSTSEKREDYSSILSEVGERGRKDHDIKQKTLRRNVKNERTSPHKNG